MAGIYIHIPFCRKACNYCDFHFSTQLKSRDEMVRAMTLEMENRKEYLGEEKIETLYFGGGTPSLLTQQNLEHLFNALYKHFNIVSIPEITLEANPDDLRLEKIKIYQKTPINRFSVGIQSFFEEDLLWMNRSHNAEQALTSIKQLQDFGYTNLSIDLIFGYKLLNQEKWIENIKTALILKVPHISSYGMTIEKGTLLGNQANQGKYREIEDTLYTEQYLYMLNTLETSGYEAYEISNFAKPGFQSQHNGNYWKRKPYLGIGPSAHSFHGNNRSWNISNNALYIKGILENKRNFEEEILSPENHFNEYILTALRTQKGIGLSYIELNFKAIWKSNLLNKAKTHINQGNILVENSHLKLSSKGKLISDRIIQDLI